jgi:hypothetical protein
LIELEPLNINFDERVITGELVFAVLRNVPILSAFKTSGKTFTTCPAEKKENVIKWRYTSAKRCAVRTGTRSA